MALAIDHAAAEAKLRLSGFIVANHFLVASETLRRAFGLSHEDVLLVLTVALGNVQRMLRSPDDGGLAVSDALVDQDRIVPVSRRALARATGLPRETVRRRSNALLQSGVLLEWEQGLRTARRLVLAPAVRAAIHALLEQFAGTARLLLREGVLVDPA